MPAARSPASSARPFRCVDPRPASRTRLDFAPSSAAYVILRTGLGAAVALRSWRENPSSLAALGHLAAEACALLALTALFHPALAASVGRWWIAIVVYAVTWEAVRIRIAYWHAVQSPSASDASVVDTLGAPLLWVWELVGAFPPIAAAAYLAWTALVSAP